MCYGSYHTGGNKHDNGLEMHDVNINVLQFLSKAKVKRLLARRRKRVKI